MSRENVLEILSHVDMSKIDLTSFKIGAAKFDEMGNLYRNVVIVQCILVINADISSKEERDAAFHLLKKIIKQPDGYSYDHIYREQRELVDEALNSFVGSRRNNQLNDIKKKAIEDRMKKSYKQMREVVQSSFDAGNSFQYEFDDDFINNCLTMVNKMFDKIEAELNRKIAERDAVISDVLNSDNASSVPISDTVEAAPAENKKTSFWKKLFHRNEIVQ